MMVLTEKTSAGYGIKLPKMQVICGFSCSQGGVWPRQNFWEANGGVSLTVNSGANSGIGTKYAVQRLQGRRGIRRSFG